MTAGDIVENEYLAGALRYARDRQQLRDVKRFQKARTHRERTLSRAGENG